MAISGITGTSPISTASNINATQFAEETQSNFLKLLVAQMKYQDPTNPMDNSQMTSQISQMNMVSGINSLNDTLSAMAGNVQQNSDSVKATSLLNRNVLVPGAALALSNNNADFSMDLKQAADNVQITIKDSSGQVVHTMELGPQDSGLQNLTWDGVTDDGTAALPGRYSFSVNATQGSEPVPLTQLSWGKVDKVTMNGGVVRLDVGSLGNLALSDVREAY